MVLIEPWRRCSPRSSLLAHMDLPLDLRHASIMVREATRAVLTLVLEPPGNDNRCFVVFVRPSTLQSDRL